MYEFTAIVKFKINSEQFLRWQTRVIKVDATNIKRAVAEVTRQMNLDGQVTEHYIESIDQGN